MITIPKIQVTSTVIGTTQIPGSTPFYYAAISSIWVHWLVDISILNPYLTPYGLEAADFGGGRGLVNVSFFNALAQYGAGQRGNSGGSIFNETEINLVAYPSVKAPSVPTLSPTDYLAGADQTKLFGNYRLWVACDDPIAVAAGQQLYFENKFLTQYDYNIPAMNNAGQSQWAFKCWDTNTPQLEIYDATVDLTGLSSTPGNMSEWIDYSFAAPPIGRPVASRRNYFGMYDTFLLGAAAQTAVKLNYGTSSQQMRTDMINIIGNAPAFAVQRYQSPTVIAEARPYYADM
jgi:hypothetical protein